MSTCVTRACLYGTETLALTTTTKAASVRKQLDTKNSKSNEDRHANNGGVKGRECNAEEFDRDWRGADYSGLDT